MAEQMTQLAVFSDVDNVAKALDSLREAGVQERQMEVISGIPFSHEVLGRPQPKTVVPRFSVFLTCTRCSSVDSRFSPCRHFISWLLR
jgi:hypothetical protein